MNTNPGKTALFAILLFIGAYAAGYYGHTVPSAEPNSAFEDNKSKLVVFVCPSSRAIAADFRREEVRLALSDGRQMVLGQTVSASGARYTNDDESVVFWNKGNSAFVQEEGDMITYDNCLERSNENTSEIPTPIEKGVVNVRSIIEDSRCPINVLCIQAGTVRVSAEVDVEGKKEVAEFTLNKPNTVLGKTITLTQVMPSKMAGEAVAFKDYTFTFEVK